MGSSLLRRSFPRAAAVSYLALSNAVFSILILIKKEAAIKATTPALTAVSPSFCRTTRLRLFARYSFDSATGSDASDPSARSTLYRSAHSGVGR